MAKSKRDKEVKHLKLSLPREEMIFLGTLVRDAPTYEYSHRRKMILLAKIINLVRGPLGPSNGLG